ncbi:MAG: hypothetical protein HYR96_10755 [Deltaproteobacteria bacterium]|nr:hypothetical protein [Deltaproteobacteria bacterium]MBI3293632.1 hypothetical protein [Deltaproteobacteria bacterium]
MTLENIPSPDGADGVWLPLVEYSLKSGVSLSTIRRKIKTNAIPFRLERGKYLILFSGDGQPLLATPMTRPIVPPTAVYAVPQPRPAPQIATQPQPAFRPIGSSVREREVDNETAQIPLIDRTVRMVSEAFESALKQKDEHIRLLEIRNNDLEERVNELQLLVKVLEEKYSIEY